MFIIKTFQRLIIILSSLALLLPTDGYPFASSEAEQVNNPIAMGHSGHKGQRRHQSVRHGQKPVRQGHKNVIKQGRQPLRQPGGLKGYQNYPRQPEPQTETYYPQYYPNEMEESEEAPEEMYFDMPEDPVNADNEEPSASPAEEEQPPVEEDQPQIEKNDKPQKVTPPPVIKKKIPNNVAKNFHQLPVKIRFGVYDSCYDKYMDDDETDEFMKELNYNLFLICITETANRYFIQHPGSDPESTPPAKREVPLAPPMTPL